MDIKSLHASNDNANDQIQARWEDYKREHKALVVINLDKIREFLTPDLWFYIGFFGSLIVTLLILFGYFNSITHRILFFI